MINFNSFADEFIKIAANTNPLLNEMGTTTKSQPVSPHAQTQVGRPNPNVAPKPMPQATQTHPMTQTAPGAGASHINYNVKPMPIGQHVPSHMPSGWQHSGQMVGEGARGGAGLASRALGAAVKRPGLAAAGLAAAGFGAGMSARHRQQQQQ